MLAKKDQYEQTLEASPLHLRAVQVRETTQILPGGEEKKNRRASNEMAPLRSFMHFHTSMIQVCCVVHCSQGKYGEAEPLLERCEAIQRMVLGPGHPSFAETLGYRAVLLERQVRAAMYNPECCQVRHAWEVFWVR